MRALLSLAHCHGGMLGSAWHQVLTTLQVCILDILHHPLSIRLWTTLISDFKRDPFPNHPSLNLKGILLCDRFNVSRCPLLRLKLKDGLMFVYSQIRCYQTVPFSSVTFDPVQWLDKKLIFNSILLKNLCHWCGVSFSYKCVRLISRELAFFCFMVFFLHIGIVFTLVVMSLISMHISVLVI